jgi:hypothetical protein
MKIKEKVISIFKQNRNLEKGTRFELEFIVNRKKYEKS